MRKVRFNLPIEVEFARLTWTNWEMIDGFRSSGYFESNWDRSRI